MGAHTLRCVDVDASGERADLTRVLLEGRLAAALIHPLNPKLPHEEVGRPDALAPPHSTLIQNNRG